MKSQYSFIRHPVSTQSSPGGVRSFRLRKGFTLVEMLVVIAIIAILISLMTPALQSIRRKALSTKCKSNLHRCGAAFHVFVSDNSGSLPRNEEYGIRDGRNWPAPFNGHWFHAFAEAGGGGGHSTGKGSIYRCPAASVEEMQYWMGDGSGKDVKIIKEDHQWQEYYGYNLYLSSVWNHLWGHYSDFANGGLVGWGKLLHVRTPAGTILLADAGGGGNNSLTNGRLSALALKYGMPGSGSSGLAPWHEGRINLLFVDGHVGSVRVDRVVPGFNLSHFYPAEDFSRRAPNPPPLPGE